MKLQQATIEDLEDLIAFYEYVTDNTPGIANYAQWQNGKHPTAEGIKAFVEEGSMYLYKENAIVGALALTMHQEECYHPIEWTMPLADDEVSAIHILAVSPDKQGAGIGANIVRESIRLAKEKGKKAVRLDATASNTPVHRLYERLGFVLKGKQRLYAENTGWLDFFFFEYDIPI